MLHFSLASGGASPITDDQGEAGVAIFAGTLLDGTLGGDGDSAFVLLYLFNDDNNHQYLSPVVSLNNSDLVAQDAWFTFLDDEHVLGTTPTQAEWNIYGVAGDLTMTLKTVSNSGGLNPQRKFWLRVQVPAGINTQTLTGVKLNVTATEEAV